MAQDAALTCIFNGLQSALHLTGLIVVGFANSAGCLPRARGLCLSKSFLWLRSPCSVLVPEETGLVPGLQPTLNSAVASFRTAGHLRLRI